jgi:glycerol-3-phosphate dehydrogenase
VWAGLRPLLAPPEHGRQSERTADLSRRHTVDTSASGVVTVTGGKLTTYRKMAEDTVDVVVRRLGGPAARRSCATKRLRLRGAPAPVAGGDPTGGLAGADHSLVAHLLGRYGSEARMVLDLARDRPELLQPVVEGLPYLAAEVVYAARHEMARTVEDVMARRTRAAIQRGRQAADAAGAVAGLLAPELGWSEEEAAAEAAAFATRARDELVTAGVAERADAPVRS